MSEGVIRALLMHAGYHVRGSGIEILIPEITQMSREQYLALDFPDAMRLTADFTVLNADHTKKDLVEVKYRTKWNHKIFKDIKEQVILHKTLTLVCITANPPKNIRTMDDTPARIMRGCRLRVKDGVYQIEYQSEWVALDTLDIKTLWWKMQPLQKLFPAMDTKKDEQTLIKAAHALRSIIDAWSDDVAA